MPQDDTPPPDAAELNKASCDTFPDQDTSTTESCPKQREITVYVRRDFPVRRAEILGAWKWSLDDGSRNLHPAVWSDTGEAAMTTGRIEDDLIGWGLGEPELRAEGHRKGQLITDHIAPIKAKVILRHNGTDIATESTADARGKNDIRNGKVDLETHTGLSGRAQIIIEPEDHETAAKASVGFEGTRTLNAFLYRRVVIDVNLDAGELAKVTDPYDPPAGHTIARIGNRMNYAPTRTVLPVSLKPDWWAGGNGKRRKRGGNDIDVDMVVLHCTSGPRMGPAIQKWFYDRREGPHYAIDTDGHVIKMDIEKYWLGTIKGKVDRWERHATHVPSTLRSVNIEIVSPNEVGPRFANYAVDAGPQPYTPEQYRSIIRICKQLKNDFPLIKHRFVGHSDVASESEKVSGHYIQKQRRNFDPGIHFEWQRLEAEGIGMKLGFIALNTCYDSAFVHFEDLILEEDDADAKGRQKAKYGRRDTAKFSGEPIRILQKDLMDIGYTLKDANGTYDKWTTGAVRKFQIHFFSGTRARLENGKTDPATASAIRFVAKSITGV